MRREGEHDIVVVGAGPSGSYAAMRCAEMGLDVLLLDRYAFPRDKACGGVVGEAAVRLIGSDVLDIMEREGAGNALFWEYEPIGYVNRREYFFTRRKFDHYLVQRAVAAGAGLQEGVRVTGLARRPDGVTILVDGGGWDARLVIGADGTNSVVGRAVGLWQHRDNTKYASIKAEIPVTRSQAKRLDIEDPPKQNSYFFRDLMGFAWLIPNNGQLNAGYGCTMSKANGLRSRFLRFLKHFGLPPVDVRGAQIPYLPLPRVYAERVLLTGDAGGFVNPWTGCGIDDGLMASERAAMVAKMACDGDDFSLPMLRRFQDLSRRHLRHIRWRGQSIKVLDRITPPDYAFPSWVKYVVKQAARWA
jgi:geranylgeranyl reductase family protein